MRKRALHARPPFRDGWPAKIGIINAGLLPDVGEGINGSPSSRRSTAREGGEGPKIGVTPAAGPGYVLNADGSSCYGSTEGKYNALQTDVSAGNGKTDTPAFPAVGEPAFGTLDGTTTNMFAPGRGAAARARRRRPRLPEGQPGLHRVLEREHAASSRPASRRSTTTSRFITGETVGDITGEAPKQEVVAGTASQDLQAYNAKAAPASTAWPKLTGGWTRRDAGARLAGHDRHELARRRRTSSRSRAKARCRSTRRPAAACSPSSWPNFHHDIANSGDYTRDAVTPGVPLGASVGEQAC